MDTTASVAGCFARGAAPSPMPSPAAVLRSRRPKPWSAKRAISAVRSPSRESATATLNGLPPGCARYSPSAPFGTRSTSASPITVIRGDARALTALESAQRCPRRRDPGAVALEHVSRSGDLQPDVVAVLAAERGLHLRHERHLLAMMLDGHVDEDLWAQVLDRADTRPQGPVAHAKRLGPETHGDVSLSLGEQRVGRHVESHLGPADLQRPLAVDVHEV